MKFFRVIILFTCFFIILNIFNGCKKQESEQTEMTSINGFHSDNTKTLDSMQLETYELEDLKNYFGGFSAQERSFYQLTTNTENLKIENLDKLFRIECLRFNKNSYYSIFNVKNGGLYYVFWEHHKSNTLIATFTCYISSLRNNHDFDGLQMGVDTYNNVLKIDPSSELVLILSNGIYSYSILNNKKMMRIEYQINEDLTGRDSFIVKNKKIVDRTQTGTYLSSILDQDLINV